MKRPHPPRPPRTFQGACARLLAACTVLTLAACSLLPAPDAQTTYTLPTFRPAPQAARAHDWVLRVDTPQTTAPLDTRQVLVQYPNASLASWRGILWADRAPVLLRARLAQALADSGLFTAVLTDNTGARVDAELSMTLRSFQVLNPDTDAQVEVRVQAQLIHTDVLGQKLFSFTQSVDAPRDPDAVVAAFGHATDTLAAALQTWLQDLVRTHTPAEATP